MQLSLSLFISLTGEEGARTPSSPVRERKRKRERVKEGGRDRKKY